MKIYGLRLSKMDVSKGDLQCTLLRHLKKAETEFKSALALFAQIPTDNQKREMKRMSRLIETIHLLQEYQFDLPHEFGDLLCQQPNIAMGIRSSSG